MEPLKIGTVCIIDQDNKKYSQKAYSPCIGIISSINEKKTFFGNKTYDIYIPDLNICLDQVSREDFKVVTEMEEYKKASELAIIRNPVNLPEFNIYDKAALVGALQYINGEIDRENTDMSGIVSQLEKMIVKLNFYEGMNDI